jgi:hypothetical protein
MYPLTPGESPENISKDYYSHGFFQERKSDGEA